MTRHILPLAALALACGSPELANDAAAPELPLLALSGPTLEIGVLEGADEYLFDAIESVVRLGDGTIGVSDAGSTRISVYGPTGTFLRRWGQKGEGPEEFRSLSRLYPHGPDSVMAADRATSRLSVYDLEGSLGRHAAGVELSGDSLFTLDAWLYGRFWIDGALTADARARVRVTLDGFPPPRTGPGYRTVRVEEGGGLWIQEPDDDAMPMRIWTRTDPDGTPIAAVTVPANFRPTYIDGDDVLGVWVGESDVNFVRGYRIRGAGETRPVPPWLRGVESAFAVEVTPDDDELMELMRGSIKMMASAQEIYYSQHYSYTTLVDSLTAFEKPEGLEIDFAGGNARGWTAVFTHSAVDRVCALAYGFDVPPGWTPGMIMCGPEAARSSVAGG